MAELDNSSGANTAQSVSIKHYISTGSAMVNSIGPGATSVYGVYNNEAWIGTHTALTGTGANDIRSGVRNFELVSPNIEDRQGMYCRIRSVVYIGSDSLSPLSTVKLKSFVYRASRSIGGSIIPPLIPIK